MKTRSEPGPRILVVDDDNDVLDFLGRVLVKAGFRVVVQPDPEDAVRSWAQDGDGFDLLLTDIVLPKFFGPKLYERLAAKQPSLRVLYMSGFPDIGRGAGRTRDPGAPFIYKPFSGEQLLDEVEKVLSRPAPDKVSSAEPGNAGDDPAVAWGGY